MKRNTIAILCALLALLPVLSACRKEEEAERLFTVVLAENEHFGCAEPVKRVKAGEDAAFLLEFEEGYAFDRADCACRIEEEERGTVLTVEDVRFSRQVEVGAKLLERHLKVSLSGVEAEPVFCAPGEDVSFSFEANGLASVGYAGEYEIARSGSTVTLTLKDITAPLTVPVRLGTPLAVEEGQRAVEYLANGGTGESVTKVSLSPRIRVNTALGDLFGREGYTQTGWNTSPDGSGRHIGLGSRVEAPATLYAEWEEWTDGSLFSYELVDAAEVWRLYTSEKEEKRTLAELSASEEASDSAEKAAIVTNYSGKASELVLPAELDGYPVRGIEQGSVTGHAELKRAVLCPGLEYIAPAAFDYNYYFTELTLFDDLVSLGDKAFGFQCHITKLFLNAVLPPAYGDSENGQLGNKLDMLQKEQKKIVLFGGCSVWYGVIAEEAEKQFSGYEVFNLGVIGGTCALYQLDLILARMGEGDVLVHMPELASQFQLLADINFDARVFITLECNYDYISELDLSRYENVFSALSGFLGGRRTLMSAEDYVPATYAKGLDTLGERGDLFSERSGNFDNEGLPYQFLEPYVYTASKAADRAFSVYSAFAERGVEVLLGVAPMNSDGIRLADGNAIWNMVKGGLSDKNTPAKVFMELEDGLLEKRYFYDTNYHLSNEGAEIFTERVVSLIKAAGIG